MQLLCICYFPVFTLFWSFVHLGALFLHCHCIIPRCSFFALPFIWTFCEDPQPTSEGGCLPGQDLAALCFRQWVTMAIGNSDEFRCCRNSSAAWRRPADVRNNATQKKGFGGEACGGFVQQLQF
eukprot:3606994-Amphidinium_carterae.1